MESLTRPIVLLTDFGLRDFYVGQVKCVLNEIAPTAPVIDLSHEVEPYAIDEAAWMLETSLHMLPGNAVVMAVVDPGVGTSRRPIAVRAGERVFVGPDNGILSPLFPTELRRGLAQAKRVAIQDQPGLAVRELAEPRYWRRTMRSNTFHGRDIFAPVAAHVAKGVDFRDLGPPVSDVLLSPECCATPATFGEIHGYVVHIDRYGSLITTVKASQLFHSFELHVGGKVIDSHVRTFGDAPRGELFCHADSSGYVAVAVREANAAKMLGVSRGAEVKVLAR